MSLIEKMQSSIDTMSMGEKLLGGLQVTAFGLIIVFTALIILYYSILLMSKVLNTSSKKEEKKPVVPVVEEEIQEEVVDDGELVAVISAAVAASLHTSTHNIIVRNIVRVGDNTPAWAKAGRMSQVNQ